MKPWRAYLPIPLLLLAVASIFWVWSELSWVTWQRSGLVRVPESFTGIFFLGAWRSVVLVLAGAVAASVSIIAQASRWTAVLVAGTGLAFTASALRVVAEWRHTARTPGAIAFVTAIAGLGAVGVVAANWWRGSSNSEGRARISPSSLLAVAAVAAFGVLGWWWPLRHTEWVDSFADLGPFEQIGTGPGGYGLFGAGGIVISDGRPGVRGMFSSLTFDDRGRAVPVANEAESGVIDGRLVFNDLDGVWIADVATSGRSGHVHIPDAWAYGVTADGVIWLRDGDLGRDAVRIYRTTIGEHPPGDVDRSGLERFEHFPGLNAVPGSFAARAWTSDAVFEARQLDPGNADAVYRWRAGTDDGWVHVAGGRDPACGFTDDPGASYLGDVSGLADDRSGGIWIAARANDTGADRLFHLGDDGALRQADLEVPMAVESIAVGDDGHLLVLGEDEFAKPGGLWRLTVPPEPLLRAGEDDGTPCEPGAPPSYGEPLARREVTTFSRSDDALVVPLSVEGRRAVVREGGVDIVQADGAVRYVDGLDLPSIDWVTPDGDGGAWVVNLEEFDADDPRWDERGRVEIELIHVDQDAEVDQCYRLPRFYEHFDEDAASALDDSLLAAATGDRPPAALTSDGMLHPGHDGELHHVIDASWNVGNVTGMVGDGEDGLWVIREGELFSVVDGEATRHAGRNTPENVHVAWSIQLNRGVEPKELWLGDSTVLRDRAGNVLLIGDHDGVVLRFEPGTGVVDVIAQDPGGEDPRTVEGGIAGAERTRIEDASGRPTGRHRWTIEEVVGP